MPGRKYTPATIPMTVWIEQAPDPRLPSTNRRWTTSTAPPFLLLLGQAGGAGEAGWAGWAAIFAHRLRHQTHDAGSEGTLFPPARLPPTCRRAACLYRDLPAMQGESTLPPAARISTSFSGLSFVCGIGGTAKVSGCGA